MLNLSLLKKELNEYLKTPKIIILATIFLFFAILSPLLAKYMNEILLAVATDIEITFPEPTLNDSWVQFFKNTHTLSFIIFLILVTGTVSQEKNKGSITLVLTKNVSRFEFLFYKFLASIMIFTGLYAISVLFSAFYTNRLFDGYLYDGFIASLIIFYFMGVFYIALGLLVSTIGKTPTTSALFGFFGFAILQVINVSSKLSLYNPAGASSITSQILTQTFDFDMLWISIVIPILSSVILFLISYMLFKKQEI